VAFFVEASVEMPPWSLIKGMLGWIILPSAFLGFCIPFVIPRRLLVAAAIWIGLVICNYFNNFFSGWVPESLGLDALLPVLLIALVAVNFLTVPKKRLDLWWILRGVTVGASGMVFLVSSDIDWSYRAGLGVCCCVLQLQLEKAQELVPRWLLAGLLSATGLAASIVAAHAHAGKPADVALVMFAAWAGLTLAALQKRLDLRIAFSLAVLTIPCVLLTSRFYSDECKVPWSSFLLVALAPLSSVIAFLPERWSNSPRLQYASMSILWIFFLILAASNAALAEKLVYN
jgi:hypothetical protein